MKRFNISLFVLISSIFAISAQNNEWNITSVTFCGKLQPYEDNVASDFALRKPIKSSLCIDNIVGEYVASGVSAFQGEKNWKVEIVADENDINKVWITPVFEFVDKSINAVYANVDLLNSRLILPMGQILYCVEVGSDIVIGSSVDGEKVDVEGDIILYVDNNKKSISFESMKYVGIGNVTTNQWWYDVLLDITYDKIVPQAYVYEFDNSVHCINAEQIYFNRVNGELCVTEIENYVYDKFEGKYMVTGVNLFDGKNEESWQIAVSRDKEDTQMLRIHPIFRIEGLGRGHIKPIYANCDENSNKITLKLGQTIYGDEDNAFHIVLAYMKKGGTYVDTSSDIIIEESVVLNGLFGAYDLKTGNWYKALDKVSFEKFTVVVVPLSNVEKITR